MKPSPRWLVPDGEHLPAKQVAARTLRRRLDNVWAELCAACADGQPERIHRLRVATRRSLAAVEAFRDLLPVQRAAWFEKRLRRIRRTAGDARDLDVLTERLIRESAPPSPPTTAVGQRARNRLVAMLSRKRDVSRQPIRELRETLTAADWAGRTERLVDGITRRRGRMPFGRYARRRFRPLMERFFARADHKLHDAEEIHRLRIEGKKLRYSLEIFAGVFAARVRVKCQECLEQLQRTLGEFTDHASAADRFRRWSRENGTGAERETLMALRKAEDVLADKARRVFGKWWNATRRRQLRRAFERTLKRRTSA